MPTKSQWSAPDTSTVNVTDKGALPDAGLAVNVVITGTEDGAVLDFNESQAESARTAARRRADFMRQSVSLLR